MPAPFLGSDLTDSPWFWPVRVATTGPINLFGLQTIDGVALAEGDRVLDFNQTNPINNGIRIASAGTWNRAPDANDKTQWATGIQVFVNSGTINRNRTFFCTSANPIVLGLTAITFSVSLTPAGARQQRSITSSANLPVLPSDSILNINATAPLTITVPLANTRAGAPLTFKDVGAEAQANNITINATAPDTFDGLTAVQLTINYQGITLTPRNDGVNSGYSIL